MAKDRIKKIEDLKNALFAATDGRVACAATNKLSKHAKNGDEQAKKTLGHYSTDGQLNHVRVFACACLADSVTEPNAEFAALFRRTLQDPQLRYWSILGYMNSEGAAAYPGLVRLAEDTNIPLAERAHAVKCLAVFSRQRFDRSLPADPSYWKESDLRLSEVQAWAQAGYPTGEGYSPPVRHPALDGPATAFEQIVSRLDKKLAKKRRAEQNLAEPENWLAIAAQDEIQGVTARWHLPPAYLDFLTRFSPVRVTLTSKKFDDDLQLFGAGELIEAQNGYSFNSIEQQPLNDWPAHLVVIASHGGDPFVLDLSKADGEDAPVDTAEHGTGLWEWTRFSNTFCEFLERLARSCS